MSTCSGCNPDINCPEDQDTVFPYSLTPGSPFPYVVNCPEGVNCSEALSITMQCCGSPVTATVPAGASADERAAIVQQLVAQCAFLESGCANPPTSPPPGTPNPPTIPPGSNIYFSHSRRVNVSCASGGTYTYEVEAGRFAGRTQAEADSLARIFAIVTANANKFCLNPPCLCPCADVAATLNINTVGGTGPFSFSILTGTLPTGLTMAVVGGVLRVSGTPTVAGNSTISLRVYDSLGGYLTRSLTFYVIEIMPSFLSDGEVDTEYSEQLSVTGGVGPCAFSLLSGSLPDGLTLSDEGLISGTPTTADEFDFTVLAVDTGITGHAGCQQEYTVEIVAQPEFTEIYYSCETINIIGPFDATTPNVAGGGTMGGHMSLSAGFIGNGMTVETQINAIAPDSEIFLRFWYKTPPGAEGFEFLNMVNVHMSVITGGFVRLQHGASVLDSTAAVNDGSWHRIVFMADTGNGVYRLKIDNNATQTVPIPGPSGVAVFLFQAGYIDEVFIIPSWMPSEANLLTDWNGGSGKTWPAASFQ